MSGLTSTSVLLVVGAVIEILTDELSVVRVTTLVVVPHEVISKKTAAVNIANDALTIIFIQLGAIANFDTSFFIKAVNVSFISIPVYFFFVVEFLKPYEIYKDSKWKDNKHQTHPNNSMNNFENSFH